MATTSFFYSPSTGLEPNTVDALLDTLNAKVAEADVDRVAAEQAAASALQAAVGVSDFAQAAAGSATQAISATVAAQSAAATATAKATETLNFKTSLSVESAALGAGVSPTVSYDDTTIKMTFGIPAGPTGPQGIQGITGNTGLTGPQGPQGIQGIKGDTGDVGATGLQGSTGATGSQGIQGLQGIQGIQGDTGAGLSLKGTQPTVGDLPATGNIVGDGWLVSGVLYTWDGAAWVNAGNIQGPQGIQGTQGIQGDIGLTGPTGPQGIQGTQGTQGIQGIQGDIGLTGPTGPQGIQGPVGSDATVNNTNVLTAIGYTPVNKAGDTLTGALGVVSLQVGGTDTGLDRDAVGILRVSNGSTGTGTLRSNLVRETSIALPANDINLLSGAYFTKTITGATTLTVSNVASSGVVSAFVLDLTNGGAGAVTYFSGVKWAGGTAPTLTAAGRDTLGFFTHDGGTTWSGFVLGKDIK